MVILKSAIDQIRPKSRLEWSLYFFVLFCALRPWAFEWIMYPKDPAEVRIMYRSPPGDVEYFPLINALSRGNIGEAGVLESKGTGVQSFPVASVIYHAVATALFGPLVGFILVDIFVTFVIFLLLRAWCRLFSPDELWTTFLAALYASGGLRIMNGLGLGIVQLAALWGERIPRPFVTDTYLMSAILLLTCMAWNPTLRSTKWSWILLGAILALSLQSFIYYLPMLGIATAFVVLQWMIEDKAAIPRVLTNAACTILTFLLLIIPFICQRVFDSPDGAGRLGLTSVDRSFVWLHTPWMNDPAVLCGLVFVGGLALASHFAGKQNQPTIPGKVLWLFAVMQCGAFLAIPLTATLTGKLIQALHFFIITGAIQTVILLALVAYSGLRFIPKTLCRPWVVAILLGFAFCLVPYHSIHRGLLSGPVVPTWSRPPGPKYHEALASLVRELNRDFYKDSEVAAMIDDAVYAYWVGFRGKSAFFPQAGTSTLSNREIENRMLWFAREERLDHTDLSVLNYKAPATADFSQEPDNAARLYTVSGYGLPVPQAEIQRLQSGYDGILAADRKDMPRLDLIILAVNTREFVLPDPDPSRYVLTYHNDYFRVWKAIKPGP